MRRIAVLIDPQVFPAQRALTESEIRAIYASRDPEEVQRKQNRLDKFNELMLLRCAELLPSDAMAAWTGDLTIDGTVVPVMGRYGTDGRRRAAKAISSVEPNAFWSVKAAEDRDSVANGSRLPGKGTTFGYEAHLAAMTGPDVEVGYPGLILGLSFDTPGQSPGQNSITILRSLARRGLPAGMLTVDRGYSQLKEENFAEPLRALGYTLNCDYKDTELGTQGNHKGALLIEGAWSGPCMPKALQSATQDYRAGRIDTETYKRRIAERERYKMRSKGPMTASGSQRMRCPAQGDGATLICPLREPVLPRKGTPANSKAVQLSLSEVPDLPLEVCTNKESTSFPLEKGIKHIQPLAYASPVWASTYAKRRNQIEGLNRRLKNGATTKMGDPDLRRVRGLGKQNLVLVALLVGFNVHSALRFCETKSTAEQQPRPRPGRPAGRPKPQAISLEEDAPPLRVAGWSPTRKLKKTA